MTVDSEFESLTSRDAGLQVFKNTGLAIRILRELSGQKQATLARRSGIGKGQLSKYETRKDLPRLESLGKVLLALNVSAEFFFRIVTILDRIDSGSDSPELPWDSDSGALITKRERQAFQDIQRDLLQLYELQIMKQVLPTKGLKP